MKLKVPVVTGTACNRKTCLKIVSDGQRHGLTGNESQALTSRRLDVQPDDLRIQVFDTLHLGLDLLHGNVVGALGHIRLNNNVRKRTMSAHQKTTLSLFSPCEGIVEMPNLFEFT